MLREEGQSGKRETSSIVKPVDLVFTESVRVLGKYGLLLNEAPPMWLRPRAAYAGATPRSRSTSARRRIFPEADLGISSTNSTSRMRF